MVENEKYKRKLFERNFMELDFSSPGFERGMVFAALVDDPLFCPEKFNNIEEQEAELKRLIDLCREVSIHKEKPSDEIRIQTREAIRRSYMDPVPPLPEQDEDVIKLCDLSFGRVAYRNTLSPFGATRVRNIALKKHFYEKFDWKGPEARSLPFSYLAAFFYIAPEICNERDGTLNGAAIQGILSLYKVIRERWDESDPVLPPYVFCLKGASAPAKYIFRLAEFFYSSMVFELTGTSPDMRAYIMKDDVP